MAIETAPRPMLLSPESWTKVDLMREALANGIARHECPSCGRVAPIKWLVQRAPSPPPPGPFLAKAEDLEVRVVALRHERFCSLLCHLRFMASSLRRDGPGARRSVDRMSKGR